MKTKQAVAFVLKHRGWSKYRLAAEMGSAPISVDQWLKRTRMSRANADTFYKKFRIVITDAV